MNIFKLVGGLALTYLFLIIPFKAMLGKPDFVNFMAMGLTDDVIAKGTKIRTSGCILEFQFEQCMRTSLLEYELHTNPKWGSEINITLEKEKLEKEKIYCREIAHRICKNY